MCIYKFFVTFCVISFIIIDWASEVSDSKKNLIKREIGGGGSLPQLQGMRPINQGESSRVLTNLTTTPHHFNCFGTRVVHYTN